MELLRAGDSVSAQRAVAGALAAQGLRPGDRIVLQVSASAALLSAVLAALRRGIIPVVLDPKLTAEASETLVTDAAPALVVTSDTALAALFNGPPADLADVPLARPMHYTSGTTGARKGVWSGVLAEDDARALAAEEDELWGFEAGDRHLVLSPLHHSAPLRFAIHTLLAGGEVLLPGLFDAHTALDVIARERPTTAFCVPTHLQRLLEVGALPPLDSFRLLAHAGAPCPEPVKRQVVDAFPDGTVWEFYGSTEAQFTVCSAAEWAQRPGTVGRARPGRALRTGQGDVIWCRLPEHARFSYWGAPEKTAAAWDGDELTLGDLGVLDDEGYLFLRGRRDDLVITGGVNVYPLEVEQTLDRCPGVEESAVFGVADPEWGQRLVAAVVGTAREHDVRSWARDRLAPYQRPKEYHLLDELPRTSTGKVRRLDLADLLTR